MKFVIDRKPFLAALRQASAALPGKTSLPILNAFRLVLAGNALGITATDLEIGIVRTIDCDGRGDGVAAVTASQLTGFLGALPEGAQVAVEYEAEKGRLRLRAGNARAAMFCYPGEDYPESFGSTKPDVPIAEIPARDMRAAIESVNFAAVAGATNRATMLGIFFRFDGTRLTLTAADGFRMSVRHLTLDTAATDDAQLLPPATAMTKLAKMLADDDETPVALAHRGQNMLIATMPGVEFVSRLIDGVYPDWRHIVGDSYPTRVVAPGVALSAAAKVAAVMESDKDKAILLSIAPGYEGTPGTVEITGTGEGRENGDTVTAVIEGPPLVLGTKMGYLTESIGAIATPTVAIEALNANVGFVVRPVGNDDALHIIMPMTMAAEKAERKAEAVAAD